MTPGPPMPPPDLEDRLQRLLRGAGPRPQPAEELAREVELAVRERWRAAVLTRRRKRRAVRIAGLLTAAAVALVALLLRWYGGGAAGPALGGGPPLAAVELVSGDAWIRSAAGGGGVHPVRGGTVGPDALLETGNGSHLTLRLAGGAQVRLDAATEVSWTSPGTMALRRGGLYVDSGDSRESAVTVRTPQGVARELGTRFEVRFEAGATVLRVRDGGVELEVAGPPHTARAGDELTWSPASGLSRRRIAIAGDTWSWVLDAAPPFALEGSTLEAFLTWVSRETGWEISFPDAELRRSLATATLHGSLEGVRPDQAPATVLPSLALTARLDGSVLLVEAR